MPKPGFVGRFGWLTLLAALLFVAGAGLPCRLHGATPPRIDEKPSRNSLIGQLLVATEEMGDPRFRKSVLVMIRHSADGAMGLAINRPLGERPVAELLRAIGQPAEGVSGSVPIYLGGPVEPERVFVLHSTDYRRTGTIDVTGDIAVTATSEIFRDIAAHLGPAKFLIVFGYAGWAPNQLEGELAVNAWYTATLDLKLVFDAARDAIWQRAVERRTRDL